MHLPSAPRNRATSGAASTTSLPMRHTTLAAGLAAALALAALPAARGGSSPLPVTNCNDSGPGSLRAAASAPIAPGSTIDLSGLSCSVITLTTGAIDFQVNELTLDGPGADGLTIDGNGNDRVLQFEAPVYAVLGVPSTIDVTISNLTISNGYAIGDGGCILVDGNLSLSGVVVSGCTAIFKGVDGGGVKVEGNLSLLSSELSGNTASAPGAASGGGAAAEGNVFVDFSVIADNQAISTSGTASGGGIHAEGNISTLLGGVAVRGNLAQSDSGIAVGGGLRSVAGGVSLGNSTVSGNTAMSTFNKSIGGGIQAGDGMTTTPYVSVDKYSALSGNTAISDCASCIVSGGGVQAFGPITVDSSVVRDNQALANGAAGIASGGGLASRFYGEAGRISLSNSTISANGAISAAGSTAYGGGLAATQSSPVTVRNSTIAFNRSSGSGGGISLGVDSGGTLFSYLESSMVARNSAPTGADVAANAGEPFFSIAGGASLVMDVAGVGMPADTINDDPVLLPLANHGGSTATHALASCSPAIDQGSNPDMLAFDQRGDPYARSFGGAPDIGAFEVQPDADLIFRDSFDPSPCT